MKKAIALLLAAALAALLLVGCAQQTTEQDRVLNYCLDGDINSADPKFSHVDRRAQFV
jgi:hypothetical protein